ncbi:MAG: hypothetical protein ACJ79F_02530 [Gemmatimonadaceae bacterium]
MELQPRETRGTKPSPPKVWQAIRPEEGARLSDVRQQLHHAAQFCAAAGISFLEPQQDDSHTTLGWVSPLAGLFSKVIPARTMFRIGTRPIDLSLVIATENDQQFAEYRLHGRTITDATLWVRTQIASLGGDAAHYTLRRHYEIPRHDVAIGEAFNASDRSHLEELTKWIANGASIVDSAVRSTPNAGEVRCWPDHFDISTVIQVTPDRTITIGLEPGDQYYDEPYFYVSMTPQPTASQARSRPQGGRGSWHTREWIGAVLPGSRLGSASAQEQQVVEFIDSAVSACRGLTTLS